LPVTFGALDIALVILHADPARGGAERYTVDLAHALAQRGHRVSLVASSFTGVSDSVTQVQLQAPGATRLSRYRSFLDALDQHVESARYDVVHAMLPVRRCDVYHPHAGIAAGKADQTGLRLVFNLRRKAMANVEHALLTGPLPPVVLSLSEYVKKDIRLHYPLLPDDRLVTLFNAVDTDRFDPAARPGAGPAVRERFGLDKPGAVVALMIAQDFERKGLREAILATCRSGGEAGRHSLLVVGREDTRKYEQLASRSGSAKEVIFAGRTDDPYSFYQAADFFVLPTRHDPCSLVVLEALAMGLPVVSTVFNGACEIMTDGKHGFVLSDPSDVEALAAAMRQLLDPRRREEMSRACLELRPRLAYAHHLEQLLAVYSEPRRATGR
jgi:UDP-glucose:(heptosyl)LPS alpha-1,3-glucosyltransferase